MNTSFSVTLLLSFFCIALKVSISALQAWSLSLKNLFMPWSSLKVINLEGWLKIELSVLGRDNLRGSSEDSFHCLLIYSILFRFFLSKWASVVQLHIYCSEHMIILIQNSLKRPCNSCSRSVVKFQPFWISFGLSQSFYPFQLIQIQLNGRLFTNMKSICIVGLGHYYQLHFYLVLVELVFWIRAVWLCLLLFELIYVW